MRKTCGFKSSWTCAKYHPGIRSSLKHSIVSNDSVSGQRRPWSDCADAQADLGHCCSHMLEDTYLFFFFCIVRPNKKAFVIIHLTGRLLQRHWHRHHRPQPLGHQPAGHLGHSRVQLSSWEPPGTPPSWLNRQLKHIGTYVNILQIIVFTAKNRQFWPLKRQSQIQQTAFWFFFHFSAIMSWHFM